MHYKTKIIEHACAILDVIASLLIIKRVGLAAFKLWFIILTNLNINDHTHEHMHIYCTSR